MGLYSLGSQYCLSGKARVSQQHPAIVLSASRRSGPKGSP